MMESFHVPSGTCWKTGQGYQTNIPSRSGGHSVGIGSTPYESWFCALSWSERQRLLKGKSPLEVFYEMLLGGA